jgi:phosphoribosylglycinamide formyltransferase-1
VKRVAVLASGRGSNLGALIAAQSLFPSYRVTVALSNVHSSGALALAAHAGVEALCVPGRGLAREVHEGMLLDALRARSIDIVCLAGYMRVLTSTASTGSSGPFSPSFAAPAFPGCTPNTRR